MRKKEKKVARVGREILLDYASIKRPDLEHGVPTGYLMFYMWMCLFLSVWCRRNHLLSF